MDLAQFKEIKSKIGSLIERKCPNCGASLKTNTCAYCDSEFIGVVVEDDSVRVRASQVSGCGGMCMSSCTGACTSCTGCTGSSMSNTTKK